MPHPLRLAISLGDPCGIGPEVTLRALLDPRVRDLCIHPVLCGSRSVLIATAARIGVDLASLAHRLHGVPGDIPAAASGPTSAGGRVSFLSVLEAIALATRDPADPLAADAIVTAPISKEAWNLAGVDPRFAGHTELLADAFESPRTAMLFVGPRLRVILATVHIPLRDVPRLLTTGKVRACIELGDQACRELGIAAPRIGVAGLNPHAGEHGILGDEDDRIIAPAVTAARAGGIDVSGPLSGDAIFLHAVNGRFDLVVAMYHDQGLIPVKLIDRADTVNVTTGLSWQGRRVIRTSPAHGTAYDIAGRARSLDDPLAPSPSSMVAAITLAASLTRARGAH
jgi:4-phospho-D-threonate 3-dehydrogenase / 4-phospho-D-erythronate 3-dehydrogenase